MLCGQDNEETVLILYTDRSIYLSIYLSIFLHTCIYIYTYIYICHIYAMINDNEETALVLLVA
jgi:hypothetical protein